MSMETQRSVQVSGTSVMARECPKCGKRNARGTYMVREMDGRHIFKCDFCGMKRSMGWTEASSLLMVEEKQSHQNAFDNRDRWRREFTEKFNEDTSDAMGKVESPPDVVENFNDMISGPSLKS